MEAELGLGDDAEVAAAALQRPEQVGVLVLGRDDDVAVRGHDVGRDQAVAGEAELALEPAAAAAGRESDHAGRRDAAAGDREPELLRLAVELTPVDARLDARGAALRIDAHSFQCAQIEHDPAVAAREARDRVAAAAECEREAGQPRQPDRADHVRRAGRAQDRRGAAVEHPVENLSGLVVAGVAGLDHVAAKALAQLAQCVGIQSAPCGRGADVGHRASS